MYKEVLTSARPNTEHFIYLVHGFFLKEGTIEQIINRAIGTFRDPNQFYRASLIARLNQESAKKIFGYGADIFHTAVCGTEGFILEPSSDEIIRIAWNCDLQSPYDSSFNRWVLSHAGKIKEPLELLTRTEGPMFHDNNELVLIGSPATRIVGVFYVEADSNEGRAREIAEYTSKVHGTEVPIVPIQKPKLEDGIKFSEVARIMKVWEGNMQQFYGNFP